MEKKELFVAPSLYSLFLYTLINENWTKSDYVLARIPIVILQRLRDLYGVDVYNYPVRIGENPIKKIYLRNKDYFDFYLAYKNRSYDSVWGNDEFLASYPFRKQGIILIEDGAFNSYSKEETQRRQFQSEYCYLNYWLYWIFDGYVSYGWNDDVKQIYHTTAINLPKGIAHKGIRIDLNEIWNSLSQQRKMDIFDLFGLSLSLVDKINEFSTVLVTQDLPIPDEDKIDIYKRMTDGMDMSKVLIKTHYAEKTNYSMVFPESTVISMPIPMQLFNLIGYMPKRVMTISSGAVAPFIKKGVDVVFLGTEIDPRIVAKYGVVKKDLYMPKNL
ncbi:MAG: hypothetical protein E7070_00730 [Bacteroidales bacterium]|jgi:hypothetical protein|nr:hypothetical protein [Bacteroidales bacterium]